MFRCITESSVFVCVCVCVCGGERGVRAVLYVPSGRCANRGCCVGEGSGRVLGRHSVSLSLLLSYSGLFPFWSRTDHNKLCHYTILPLFLPFPSPPLHPPFLSPPSPLPPPYPSVWLDLQAFSSPTNFLQFFLVLVIEWIEVEVVLQVPL